MPSDLWNGRSDPRDSNSDRERVIGVVLSFFAAIGAAMLLGVLIAKASRGIEFTDEGYYLNWISHPFSYSWSVSQFGFIYHPFFIAVGRSIQYIRIFNIVLSFILSWSMFHVYITSTRILAQYPQFVRVCLSGSFAIVVFLFLDTWLLTPSYNSLVLQALMVVACGLGLVLSEKQRTVLFGQAMIGIGGWLVFMAKPSTAALVAPFVGVALALIRKRGFRLILIPGAIALSFLIVSAFLIDGGIMAFAERILVGIRMLKAQDGGYTLTQILRLDKLEMNTTEGRLFFGVLVLQFVTLSFLASSNRWARKIGFGLILIVFSASVAILFGFLSIPNRVGSYQPLLFLSIPLASMLFMATWYRKTLLTIVPRQYFVLAVCLASFPYATAFGTNNNYWHAGMAAAIFPFVSSLLFMAPLAEEKKAFRGLLAMLASAFLIIVLTVQSGSEKPYRQDTPIRAQDYRIQIGDAGGSLIVSDGFGRYIDEARSSATRAGFIPGTPVIDLTGQSPTLLNFLGADYAGQAWMIGGYPGSVDMATKALRLVSSERIAIAWILLEPQGPRKLPTDILATLGADFSTDFTLVAEWKTSAGAGGYPEPRIQYLYKPIRTIALAQEACDQTRECLGRE